MDYKILGKDFLWGVATSAPQIEGATMLDGKGLSIWDVFSRIPGKIYKNETTEYANDFYHRYKDDIKIMKDLGINSYRMSLAWSRIMPTGKDKKNELGIKFYHNVIDELLKNDIIPNITLYHWDLPYALQEELGWLNRDVSNYFGDYAKLVFDEYGDKVPYFATINEPIATYVAYGLGAFAPGIKGEKCGRIANHNILLAHGKAVEAFRASKSKGKIGVVVDIWNKTPLDASNEADIALAKEGNETTHLSYLNPLFKGRYSDYYMEWLEKNDAMPTILDGDLKLISQPVDFFGCNCYSRVLVSSQNIDIKKTVEQAGGNYQQNGQEFYPRAIYDALMQMKNEFVGDMPIYVTENGAYKLDETFDENGEINDDYRIDYLNSFVDNIAKAKQDGVNVCGYYVWSLYDNWEWTGGSQFRFGLIHNDFETQKRTWKKSAYWYKNLIKTCVR